MNTVSVHQLERLIVRLEKMLSQLDRTQSIALYQAIDDSFHMQKVAELELLRSQLGEAELILKKVQERVWEHYKAAYCRWREDVRVVEASSRKLQASVGGYRD